VRIRKTLSLPGECSSRLIASANDTAGSLLPGECSSRFASGVRQKEAAGGVEEEGAGEEGADGLDERVEEDKQAEREKPMLEGDGLQVLQVLQMEEDDEDLRDGAVWGRWGWEGHTGVTGGMSCASETARPRPTRRLETSSVLKGGRAERSSTSSAASREQRHQERRSSSVVALLSPAVSPRNVCGGSMRRPLWGQGRCAVGVTRPYSAAPSRSCLAHFECKFPKPSTHARSCLSLAHSLPVRVGC
jgi:hypothetical protein